MDWYQYIYILYVYCVYCVCIYIYIYTYLHKCICRCMYMYMYMYMYMCERGGTPSHTGNGWSVPNWEMVAPSHKIKETVPNWYRSNEGIVDPTTKDEGLQAQTLWRLFGPFAPEGLSHPPLPCIWAGRLWIHMSCWVRCNARHMMHVKFTFHTPLKELLHCSPKRIIDLWFFFKPGHCKFTVGILSENRSFIKQAKHPLLEYSS